MAQYGWIKLSRSLLNNDMWTEKRVFSRAEAWIDLLLSAYYEEKDVYINGCTVHVYPGQYCTTITHLSKRWGWSRGKIYRFFEEHKDDIKRNTERNTVQNTVRNTERTQNGTPPYTLITLVNWGKYQYGENPTEHETDTERNTKRTQVGTLNGTQNKNIKNNKNNKNNNIYALNAKNWANRHAYKPYETDDIDLSVFEE